MSLHKKEHTLQSKRVHANDLSFKGELVEHEFSAELSAREMAPNQKQLQNNPMKTPPNNLTTIDKEQRKG
ncbi:hypothetical protein JOC37_002412 [Desulfohalotomaculum tongense]|uniref:hypothetical protein n=1 Tax=Desulforadius tongensis TaxID=1216062 RepID=UPI00195A16F5|nr:hypothetical protein [Desulforadius tongensis]MBM7855989.1 hypothetical protein [Desulforadius tongensis]